MIRVEDYHKTYRETVAVDGLSFEVAAGSIMGLVGPNGAGKTTTMRRSPGSFALPAAGFRLRGTTSSTTRIAAKRALAYIPDDPKLFDALTVWEHLEFIASAYRVDDFVSKGEALIEQFELVEKRGALAQELSRGMRQKVAICCAYLHEPKAILFDEPLTGLDPYAIRTLKASIADRAASGAAVVVSSHLLVLVEDLCTHLLILNKGRRLFYGSLDEARSKYASLQGDGAVASLEDVFFRATETTARS